MTDEEILARLKADLPTISQSALDAAIELVRVDHSQWGPFQALTYATFVLCLTEAHLAAAEGDNQDVLQAKLTEYRELADRILRSLRAGGVVTRKERPAMSKGGDA